MTTRTALGPGGGAVDLAVGLGLAAVQAGERGARIGVRVLSPAAALARRAYRLAPVPEQHWLGTAARPFTERGRQRREALVTALTRALHELVPRLLDLVLDEVDLTRLVRERVDLDEVACGLDLDAAAARLDLDAAAARLDLDAILKRVDLIALAEYVIDGVDLPGIIRDSTGSMASEGVRGVRMQTIGADERVNRLVDRVLLRRGARQTQTLVGTAHEESPNGGEAP